MNSLPPQQQIQLSILFARFKTKQWTLELRDKHVKSRMNSQ